MLGVPVPDATTGRKVSPFNAVISGPRLNCVLGADGFLSPKEGREGAVRKLVLSGSLQLKQSKTMGDLLDVPLVSDARVCITQTITVAGVIYDGELPHSLTEVSVSDVTHAGTGGFIKTIHIEDEKTCERIDLSMKSPDINRIVFTSSELDREYCNDFMYIEVDGKRYPASVSTEGDGVIRIKHDPFVLEVDGNIYLPGSFIIDRELSIEFRAPGLIEAIIIIMSSFLACWLFWFSFSKNAQKVYRLLFLS